MTPNNADFCVCKHCSKSFIRLSKRQVFCTDDCRIKYYNLQAKIANKQRYCLLCGKYFVTDKRTNYCSDECRKAATNRKKPTAEAKSKRNNTALSLSEVTRLAREEGLTYGKYVEKHKLK